jgi:hypothetical protein
MGGWESRLQLSLVKKNKTPTARRGREMPANKIMLRLNEKFYNHSKHGDLTKQEGNKPHKQIGLEFD